MDTKTACEKFLYNERVVCGKSSLTIKAYAVDLEQFIFYLRENEEIEDFDNVNNYTIRSYMAYLSEKGISKRSLNRKLSAIKSLFKFLSKNDIIIKNSVRLVNSPKFETNLPSFLTEAEVKELIAAIPVNNIQGVRDRAIVEILYTSGLRASELVSLSEMQIDFVEREIRVIGKGEKERITFFSKTAREWLLKYIADKKSIYDNYSKDIIFVNKTGEPLTDRSLRRLIAKYAKKSGIEKEITPHTMRHTFATLLINKGMDIRFIQELLGHSSISTTQVYTHISKELLRETYLKSHPMGN